MSEYENLPEKTKICEISNKEISFAFTGDEEWLGNPYFESEEDLNIEEKEHVRTESKRVVFEAGDRIPLTLADDVFSAFGDRIQCLDGNRNALNQVTTGSAVMKWEQ